MSVNGIDLLAPNRCNVHNLPRGGTAESGHHVKTSESFKCPNCGRTHQTVSFVKCEYCGFGSRVLFPVVQPPETRRVK